MERREEDAEMLQRIKKRREELEAKMKAAKRQANGEAGAAVVGSDGNERKEGRGDEQVARSRAELARLKTAAAEAVTRYRVVTDDFEGKRRVREEALGVERQARIDEDSSSSQTAHFAIQFSFDHLFNQNPDQVAVPQDLMRDLNELRDKCNKVIELKDKLIDELRRQMVAKEEQYVTSLKLQADDIDTLIEKMHTHTETLVGAYQRELRSVEDAYVQERRELLEKNDQEIEKLLKERQVTEDRNQRQRDQRVWEDQKVLDDKYEENAERFNKLKMEHLHDIHGLAQELESLRARFALNTEKLHYNLRVLNERVNENKKASDLHRKKLGRLQDVLSTLLAKYHETDRKYQQANRELTEGYRRVTEQYKDLQLKFQHFEKADADKFQQVWKMHEDDCMKLVHTCLQGDRVVFEEMLGVKWRSPSLDFWLEPQPDETVQAEGTAAAASETQGATVDGKEVLEEFGNVGAEVFDLIYSQVPFLIEERVRRVIDAIDPPEESLPLRVEAVLAALDVKSSEEVAQLVAHMQVEDPETGEHMLVEQQDVVMRTQMFLGQRNAKKQDQTLSLDLSKVNETQQKTDKKKDTEAKERIRQREFWAKMSTVVPESHTRLWNSMEGAMNKYLKVLQRRQNLIGSTDALRQQNDELRALLNQYLSSSVNEELFSPPQLQVAGAPQT